MKYKEFPEYKNKPSAVTNISEFKNIFWWEYIHRIIGRLIGILALIPFIYFLITKKLSNSQKIRFRMRQNQINLAKKAGRKHKFQKEY